VIHKDHSQWYPTSEHDDVKGWVSATEVAEYIQWTAQLDSDYDKVMAEAMWIKGTVHHMDDYPGIT